jgi:hypothetical protein
MSGFLGVIREKIRLEAAASLSHISYSLAMEHHKQSCVMEKR